MTIFRTAEWTMHSGKKSNFKIECDDLTDEDLDTIAMLIGEKFDFFGVTGVPTGGVALANKLGKYCNPKATDILIVDDVLTTGASMEEHRWKESIGVVIFARGPCPDWITPIFQMWEK